MTSRLVFEFPEVLLWGAPAALALLAWSGWSLRRRGLTTRRIAALLGLRIVLLAVLLVLAARPVAVTRGMDDPNAKKRAVALLVDRSESMSLDEGGLTRYQRALAFTRDQLLPVLKESSLPVKALLFDATAEPADGSQLAAAVPAGRRTDLAGAIGEAFAQAEHPPLAVIAVTDGIVNERSQNHRALTALVENQVPFIGIGFGNDRGAQTLSLRQVSGPAIVAPKTAFNLSAQLECTDGDDLPPFDLVLFCDGQFRERKTVRAGAGAHQWIENFRLTETLPGARNYTVQLLPPAGSRVKCASTTQSAAVRISEQGEVRVLYVQGALTWDYKFINLALRNDPVIKITGLTRTSKQSVFRQNVETAGELLGGFPTTLEEIASFRVLVLSNLRPADLTVPQQELLARFCGELGGGVLVLGGPGTFDASWQSSRLEQLLPVTFAANPGVLGLDRPFRMELTEEALQHPVFQISDSGRTRELWSQVPTFTAYGRVDSPKPGAHVWAQHPSDEGPRGRRILLATQRFGAGLSAILCIQNFWRWRLARDGETDQFDRFWRQFFRYLSDSGRQDVLIHLAEQELHPAMDVRVVLEKPPSPKEVQEPAADFLVRVEDASKKVLHDETVTLKPGAPAEFSFRAEDAGAYTINVFTPGKVPVANRVVDIRDVNLELQHTGRDLETLRQWASVSDGLALRAEDCHDAGELVGAIRKKMEQLLREREERRPVGVNPWTFLAVVALLAGEWLLRKRWNLI